MVEFLIASDHYLSCHASDSVCADIFPRAKQLPLDSEVVVPHLQELQNPCDLPPVGQFSQRYWLNQCEVSRDRIKHIDWIPSSPEPLYTPTGLEITPSYQPPDKGNVIYLGEESYFMYSQVRRLSPVKQIFHQEVDNTLIFEARFESGNLQKVVKIRNEFEYQLTLRTDLYTSRHVQWFYFQVSNTQAGMPYRFTIVNFTKRRSLYRHGLRPLLYSEVDAKEHNIGWRRTGNEIKYYKTNVSEGGRQYFSLTWTFQFPHDRDTCYFAHCYPYTYSNLQEYLVAISKDPMKSKFCKTHILCHSLAGNTVHVLTITNPPESGKDTKRKAVILTARVHPGETNSSWIMKGILDYILGNSGNAHQLRDTFVFKVVPMLNPDGVIVGNHRCSLTGHDLNRKYKSKVKKCYPSIWYTRNMIRRVMEKRDIFLYCDIHGHNRKQNVFMYGCEREQEPKAQHLCPRAFPLLLSKNCPDKFSFPDCCFRVRKSKESTGRVVMWKMGINNSYTLEASVCGSKLGWRRSTHFDIKDFESIGQHFCDALLNYSVDNKEEHEQVVTQQAEVGSAVLNSDALDWDSSSRSSDSSDSYDIAAHRLKLGTKKKTKPSGDPFSSTAKDRSHESRNSPGTEIQHKIFHELHPVDKVKLPMTASTKQVGKYFSSERLTCNTNSDCEKPSVPQEPGKSVFYDIILSRRENFHSSSFNLISQKTKKHNGKSVSNSSQKTFQYFKGHDHGAKSNSKKEERKTGRLSSKPRKLEKNRTARQAVTFEKSKSCQAQSASQFSLPLVPEAENRQPAAKYSDVFWSPSSSAKKGT
ncbi:LOW QUALITY PROTEIN: cytosolic carboxypeptidase 3 [Tympanuchus pallidicinctus]|uniref:LOW QUALITY PROTEIN: cytosolic carboxypeptidase 3 n=1 Tax=Tympanuchus pallidicinctus TaxID=109042 RepID=UPI00228714B7|nr:LOW QUALITY PROTEIN: cytosolic carboxypeptidase 3 [Tympanuchus pallidicinctus]